MLKSNNLRIVKKGSLEYITFPKLDATGLVANCFTTKLGGVSTGQNATMNMSFSPDRLDRPENVLENYKIICGELGVDYKKCVLSKQTHTTNILTVTEEDAGKGIIREKGYDNIDGLITNARGITLVTKYADCVPLLFLDPVKKVIATSHAGWRGTVNGMAKVTVERMANEFGCDPKDIIVGVGPSIAKCCFEVGKEVADEFLKISDFDPTDLVVDDKNGKFHVDLWEANKRFLLKAGIKKENIDMPDICTVCNSDSLFSHRATKGKRGNLAALICLK